MQQISTAIVLAAAATAATAFKDVPATHWAHPHVTFVAVERGFMAGYPDKTFRGQAAFTRTQLALALDELITELEDLSKASWAMARAIEAGGLPGDPGQRRKVERVVARYGLFSGMPGYEHHAFQGDRPVTRYEMAWLIARLLRLGEAKGVVDPAVLDPRTFAFSDLPRGDWDGQAEQVVRDVADRYQVMVGFPDGRFRGPEKLTRYQFAAAAAQTFPLIRQLVIRTQERKLTPTPRPTAVPTPTPPFQQEGLLQVGPLSRFTNGVSLGGFGRALHYVGPWFGLLDAQLGVHTCTSELVHAGTAGLGYSFRAGPSSFIQPFVGARGYATAAGFQVGPGGGVLATHWTAGPWGFYALGQGAYVNAAPLWLGTGGAIYRLTPDLGLSLDLGYGTWPTRIGTDAGATAGLGLTLSY